MNGFERRQSPRGFVLYLFAAALGLAATGVAATCASGGTSVLPPPAVDFLRGYRASFRSPARLAVDAAGRIYVADPAAGQVVVRAVDGRVLARGEELGRPVSIAVDPDGSRIFVGDGAAGRLSAYAPDWSRLFDLGQGDGELGLPSDLALDPATGNVWVTDGLEHRVEVYDSAGTWLFGFGGRGGGDGQFQSPAGIFVDDAAGEVLVVDQLGGRVQIFDRQGVFLSCLGVKGSGAGKLNLPQGIWADELGRIYVADAFEGWIHVIDRQGATVGFIGGVGDAGAGPGRLRAPSDLVIDPSGRLIVSAGTTARLAMFGLDGYADPEQFVPAAVVLSPDPLDPGVPGAALTAVIEVPGYRLELADPASLAANGVAAIPGSVTIEDVDGDHESDLVALFDGAAVAATLPPGGGTVRVSGLIGDLELEGFDPLAVIGSGGDADGDGIPDGTDLCPGTAATEAVDDGGCSLDQLCPCFGPAPGEEWRNHGQYASCVVTHVRDISHPPLDPVTRRALIKEAARSSCGR